MDRIEKMSWFDLLEKLNEIKSEIRKKEKEMHDLRLRINEESNELIKKKKLEMLTKVKPFAAEHERRKKELQKAYQLQKKRLDEKMWKEIEILQKKKHVQCDELENSFNVVQNDINEQTVNRISNLEEKHLNDIRELRGDLDKIEKELDFRKSRR